MTPRETSCPRRSSRSIPARSIASNTRSTSSTSVWPLGTAADLIGDSARQYIRASDGELNEISPSYGDRTAAEWQRLDELPPDAIETGFTTSDGGRDVELWLPADRHDRAYLLIDDVVEVWPLAEPELGCD